MQLSTLCKNRSNNTSVHNRMRIQAQAAQEGAAARLNFGRLYHLDFAGRDRTGSGSQKLGNQVELLAFSTHQHFRFTSFSHSFHSPPKSKSL